MGTLTKYKTLSVFESDDKEPDTFDECSAVIAESRVLIVIADGRHHVYNANQWTALLGTPAV